VPVKILLRDPVEVVLTGLRESHEVSAYKAVERLVHKAGRRFYPDTLLAMLDQCVGL